MFTLAKYHNDINKTIVALKLSQNITPDEVKKNRKQIYAPVSFVNFVITILSALGLQDKIIFKKINIGTKNVNNLTS